MPAALDATHLGVPSARLRLCSDDQLVGRFRAGRDEAFDVIHDRYRMRLLAYVRQMLGARSNEDAEDVLQEVFERAAQALRADVPPVGLRAWLYSVAHNRCIDELRRRPPAPPDVLAASRQPPCDTSAVAERRADVARLFDDLRALPEVQRSALLMRELQGLSHAELAHVLDASVPAVKSLLVRARCGLVDAAEARGTACATIRDDLAATHDRRVKTSARAARHLLECTTCRSYRAELRRTSRRVAALAPVPALFPLAALGRLFGGAGVHAKVPVAASGVAGTGGAFAGAGKLVALLGATTVLTTGAVLERNGALPWASPSASHGGARGAPNRQASLGARATPSSRAGVRAPSAVRLDALKSTPAAGAGRPTRPAGAPAGAGDGAPGATAPLAAPGTPQLAAGGDGSAAPAAPAGASSSIPTGGAAGTAPQPAAQAPADGAGGASGDAQTSAPGGQSLVGAALAAPGAVTQAAAGAATRLFSGPPPAESGSGGSEGSGSGSGASSSSDSAGSGSDSGSGTASAAGGSASIPAPLATATGPVTSVVHKVTGAIR